MASPQTEVKHVLEKNFSLNADQTSTVGQPIVRVKDYYLTKSTRNAWEAEGPFEVQTLLLDLKFQAGVFPVDGRKAVGGQAYDLLHLRSYNGTALPYLVEDDGRIAKIMNAYENAASDISVTPNGFKLSRKSEVRIDETRGYTNFELIYTGTANGVIHITYREYSSENLARTAFFQNLTYDSSQRIIRFRDIAIKVLSVSNERISYRVIEFPEVSHDTSSDIKGMQS